MKKPTYPLSVREDGVIVNADGPLSDLELEYLINAGDKHKYLKQFEQDTVFGKPDEDQEPNHV